MTQRKFLTAKEQVEHCKSKGVKFDKFSEGSAIKYLEENNNYFKLRAFRKNFTKNQNELYLNLDFAQLVDLAILDNRLRRILLETTLNIEHFSKVHLLKILQAIGEDGYQIVSDYMNQLSPKNRKILMKDLQKNKTSLYCGNLYAKYLSNDPIDAPVWAFIEVISFGQYLHFYEYCAERSSNQELSNRIYLMRVVKDLRNACAHNNCIINDLQAALPPAVHKQRNNTSKNLTVTQAVAKLPISSQRRKKYLNRLILHQIITTLFTHKEIVISTGVHNHIAEELQEFKLRYYRECNYTKTPLIDGSFTFLFEVINGWFPKKQKSRCILKRIWKMLTSH